MEKSILEISKREVEIEKIKLENLGLLSDASWRLGELIQALKLQEGIKNARLNAIR